MAAAAAFALAVSVAFSVMTASATFTVVSVTSAATASAGVDIFAVKAFCEFFFCCLAYGNDLSCEMQGLSGHLMVEVHPDTVFAYLQHYARNHCSDAVEHRDGIAGNQKVFAYFSVYFEG